uniref:t-SNARE coiled-coil homology domain-containing protein n=1 Tax=Timema genevievae TaxID=629358 RepID=A0A7R9PJ42_TIMGE|nr:unnamed protein product [Timema genevievae]
MATYWRALPDLVLGTLSMLGALLCLLLPETLNKTLPVTLEDVESVSGRRKASGNVRAVRRNHQIQHYTQQLAKDTSANLKDLSSLPAPMSTSEQRQWKMQKERLADEFTSALNTFQATQRRAAQKEKDQMQRVRANSGLNDPFANLSKAGLGGRYTDQLIELQDSNTGSQQQDQMMDEMNLQLLEEQEQGIRQLESDISDVNQIFKELGAMVHEQGEVIDSIEAHVEKTEVFVSEGNTQLRQASTYQVGHPSLLLCMLITGL